MFTEEKGEKGGREGEKEGGSGGRENGGQVALLVVWVCLSYLCGCGCVGRWACVGGWMCIREGCGWVWMCVCVYRWAGGKEERREGR